MNIRVRGVSYHINNNSSVDQNPDLVFLHGFLGSSELFQPLISSLNSKVNPKAVDLLGHGKTEGAELHYRFSTKEQVADLAKLISEQFSAPVILYGYSMGARLALQLTLIRPDLVRGLILESGSFGIEKENERQARQALDASRADQIIGNFEGFLDDWGKMKIFDSQIASENEEILSQVQQSQNTYWMSNALLGFGSGTMPCVKEQLEEIVVPVQLIVGAEDTKFLRINQAMKKSIPNCTLSIVENANHRVHLEQPEKCANIIEEFITKNSLS